MQNTDPVDSERISVAAPMNFRTDHVILHECTSTHPCTQHIFRSTYEAEQAPLAPQADRKP